MNTKLNAVAIRRLSCVYVPSTMTVDGIDAMVTGAYNLMTLGYALSKTAFDKVTSEDVIAGIVEAAASLRGSDVYSWQPMYPNFPAQVASAIDVELFINAVMHYVGDTIGVRIMPNYDELARVPLNQHVELTTLGIANDEDLSELARRIMVQSAPFSKTDQDDLLALCEFVNFDAPEIRISENLAWLTDMFPEMDFRSQYRTTTDVLRLAVAMMGGDVTLASPTRFTLSRAQRRTILSLLDKIASAQDMGRWTERWKRLASNLHAEEYRSRWPHAANMLSDLAQDKLPRSFDSRVEAALLDRDLDALLELLKQRPGVFARRIGHVLRVFPTIKAKAKVRKAFASVAGTVSIPVLVGMWNYFASPGNSVLEKNVVSVKSNVGAQRTVLIDNPRDGADAKMLSVIEAGIASRASLGKVYINTELFSQFSVPTGNRSASAGMRTAGRGSRLQLGGGDTLRLFQHWHDDGDSRVDIDLSAMFVSDDFTDVSEVAFYHLREDGCYHSGDITSAPEGAAEFIDINIDRALRRGFRYVVMSVYNYTGQPLDTVSECYAGFMMRSSSQSGQVFEPSTIEQKLTLSSQGQTSMPFVFDLANREAIWWDSPAGRGGIACTQNDNITPIMASLQHLVLGKKLMLNTLVKLLASKVVSSPDEADVTFDSDGDVSPYEMDKILGLLG